VEGRGGGRPAIAERGKGEDCSIEVFLRKERSRLSYYINKGKSILHINLFGRGGKRVLQVEASRGQG